MSILILQVKMLIEAVNEECTSQIFLFLKNEFLPLFQQIRNTDLIVFCSSSVGQVQC